MWYMNKLQVIETLFQNLQEKAHMRKGVLDEN